MVRLGANQRPADEIVGWLEAIGGPGEPARLAADLATLGPLARSLAVNVDVRQGMLAEKIGIECYMEWAGEDAAQRSEEHTSELQSLMRVSYAVFCSKTKTLIAWNQQHEHHTHQSLTTTIY